MIYEDEYFMQILKAAVHNEELSPPQNKLNWEYILQKAISQKTEGLLYSVIQTMSSENWPSEELMSAWNEITLLDVYLYHRHMQTFYEMMKKMADSAVKPICLKGCYLNNLYPDPEFRTMSDFDILIRPEDRETVRDIFINAGYIEKKETAVTVFSKEGFITWEIFVSMEEEFLKTYKQWDTLYLSEIEPWNAVYYKPTDTLFFLHIIVHTTKHLMERGAGVRNLCDIALFMLHSENIDWSFVKNACINEGIEKAYYLLMNAVSTFFDIDIRVTEVLSISRSEIEAFVLYMLQYGIYGVDISDNKLMNALSMQDQKKPILKILFPSISFMSRRYGYLKKYPFLLPFAWIQRVYDAKTVRNVKFKDYIEDIDDGFKYAREREQNLKNAGLK